MEFDWDPRKSDGNAARRGIPFHIAKEIFRGRTVRWVDDRIDYGETRWRILGEVGGQILHVVFTQRDGVTRIISARRANRKERGLWQVKL